MTDGDLLLRGILEYPEDDARRLVYADYLEEDGQAERAEFVRVQCELAMFPTAFREAESVYDALTSSGRKVENLTRISTLPATPEVVAQAEKYLSLRRRERTLLERWEGTWAIGPPLTWANSYLGSVRVKNGSPYGWRRGFVEAVTCTTADCLAHLDALLACHPVREVTLTTEPAIRWTKKGDMVWLGPPPPAVGPWLEVPDYRGWDTVEALKARWPRVKAWRLP